MKKRALSLALALSLCFSLSVPAMAEEMTVEEGLKPISLTSVDSSGAEFEPEHEAQNLWLGNYDMAAGVLILEELSSCMSAPTGLKFTVTNQGGEQDCYLVVHVVNYSSMSKSAVDAQYDDIMLKDEFEPLNDLSMVSGDTVYVGHTYWGGEYLCAGNVWKDGSEGREDIALPIEEGESVSFQLPNNIKDGDFCRLYVDVYYPQPEGEAISFWARYDIMMDDDAGSAGQQPSTGFSDVANDAWYAKQVTWAVENGITSGTSATTFSPDQTCTTAQILTFLWRAAGSPEATIANPFTDVAEDAYYLKPALWAYEKGLVSGTALNGNEPCTRAATVTYLWKLAGAPETKAPAFVDVASDADYAQAVQWAVDNGVTGGISTTEFGPAITCTRGQIVTFLYADFAK